MEVMNYTKTTNGCDEPMPEQRPVTVMLTHEQMKILLALRKTDEYCRESLTNIARMIMDLGIEAAKRTGKIS